MPFLVLFIVMPVLEMWLLIEVGSHIGALATIALVLLTAMVGLALLRQQGFATLTSANQRMAQGQLPAEEIATGLCLAVGGALLLTPGFVTDAIGFVCLIPGLRSVLLGTLIKRLFARGQVRMHTHYRQSGPGGSQSHGVYEGEFHREEAPGQNDRDRLE